MVNKEKELNGQQEKKIKIMKDAKVSSCPADILLFSPHLRPPSSRKQWPVCIYTEPVFYLSVCFRYTRFPTFFFTDR